MTDQSGARKGGSGSETDLLGLVGFGAFLIIVGAVFAATPNLGSELIEMITNVRLVEVYPNIFFPVPQTSHPVVYNALFQVCGGMTAASVAILAIRLFVKQPIKLKAESAGNVVFWACALGVASMIVAGGINVLMVLGYFLAGIGASMVVNSSIVLAYMLLRGR